MIYWFYLQKYTYSTVDTRRVDNAAICNLFPENFKVVIGYLTELVCLSLQSENNTTCPHGFISYNLAQ